MRYYVKKEGARKYVIYMTYSEDLRSKCVEYDTCNTEQEAIEKCEKLNAMLYPQPYIFIER